MFRYLIFLGLLAGCAGSPLHIGMMDDEDLMRVEVEDLCLAYASFNKWDSKIKVELKRRNVFTAKEWQAIEDRKIFIGMSESAFRCSWPGPGVLDLDSARVAKGGPWGVRVVYEYGLGLEGGLPVGADVISGEWPKKVFIENGVIVAYQEASAVDDSDCLTFRQRKCFEFDGLVSTKVSDALIP